MNDTIKDGIDPLIAQVIDGRYQILGVIATGGMGKVYQAQQLALGRQVAIKVMLSTLVDQSDFARRFELEARVISSMKSPHTLVAFDHGRLPNGGLYIVTEYLEGQSLYDVMRAGRMDPMRVVRIVREVCISLDEAHALGITHRDIKPQNIFLQRVRDRELAKLLDFGIAKVRNPGSDASPEGQKTTTGAFLGTPRYAAPEQFHTGAIPASDLFSLGVVAYECLTGVPFERNRPRSFADAGVAADPRIEPLVMRLLATDPADRPHSAMAVVRELELLESGQSAQSAQSGQERTQRRSFLVPGLAAAGALALGLLVYSFTPLADAPVVAESIEEAAPQEAVPPPVQPVPVQVQAAQLVPPAPPARPTPKKKLTALSKLVADDNWSDPSAVRETFLVFENRVQRCVDRASFTQPARVEVQVAKRTEISVIPKSPAGDLFFDCAAPILRLAAWPERRRPHEPATFRFEVGEQSR